MLLRACHLYRKDWSWLGTIKRISSITPCLPLCFLCVSLLFSTAVARPAYSPFTSIEPIVVFNERHDVPEWITTRNSPTAPISTIFYSEGHIPSHPVADHTTQMMKLVLAAAFVGMATADISVTARRPAVSTSGVAPSFLLLILLVCGGQLRRPLYALGLICAALYTLGFCSSSALNSCVSWFQKKAPLPLLFPITLLITLRNKVHPEV